MICRWSTGIQGLYHGSVPRVSKVCTTGLHHGWATEVVAEGPWLVIVTGDALGRAGNGPVKPTGDRPTTPRRVNINNVPTVYGGACSVGLYDRCTEGEACRCTVGGVPVGVRQAVAGRCYYPLFVRRQVSGWCLLAMIDSPSADGRGYHRSFCQQTTPPPLPQVFGTSWQKYQTVPCLLRAAR